MRSEYIFKIVPYIPSGTDNAEIANDSSKEWSEAYKSYKVNLRKYLYTQQQGRCAFCRCRISRGTEDITLEHLAPQSVYVQYRALPENLVAACIKCNRPKNKEETFLNPAAAAISFPNSSNGFIIVNPYYDNYEDYIEFLDDVIIQAKPNTGDKGKNTIDFYNLTRPELAETRAIEFRLNYKNLRHKLMQQLVENPSDDIIREIIDDMKNWAPL